MVSTTSWTKGPPSMLLSPSVHCPSSNHAVSICPPFFPQLVCDVLLSYRIPSSTVLCGLQLSPSALIIISTPPSPNLTDLPTNPSSPGSTCHLTALASPILLVLAISPPSVQMKGVDPKPRLSMSLRPIVFCCCSF